MIRAKPEKPPPEHATKWLAGTARAAYASAALFWLAQADRQTRVSQTLAVGVICWLLAYGWCGSQIARGRARLRRAPDDLARAALLETRATLCAWPPRSARNCPAARRGACRACGYVAAATALTAIAADVLLALGMIDLRGANLYFATLFTLGTASQCAANRILGPHAAAADAAWRQAGDLANLARGTSPWAVAESDAVN